MHIFTAIKNVKKLSDAQIQHFIQLMDVELKNYAKVCENYPEEKMEKYGRPYIKILEDRKNIFVGEMNERTAK